MQPSIAIVGMACCYPDAPSPQALWESVLARRRAFRAIPAQRLNLDDYYSPDPTAPDQTYATEAATLVNYEFDRVRFRVPASAMRAADLTHWLALDIAARALDDAGFGDNGALPHANTGVVVGNTLTGEFTRAGLMRLRWPYVRRTIDAQLADIGWTPADRAAFLTELETRYKAPFAPITEESLAGGLSNTIAGRICNYFDFKGGGYTVDGACASSLLAIVNACAALVAGDLDLALAGGVDLSLDPFELVGFAKAGALATGEMRVYDQRSTGFWPGEGCGFVVLMRADEAMAQQRRVYALLRGWGVSSDGNGGLTRPEVAGQSLALKRAYERAGFGIDRVTYFEGHGTGTSVGDTTELRALAGTRQATNAHAPVAWIGSIKANIGHTKAAAGLAGLIKAALALHHQVIPPATGCDLPHADLQASAASLQISPGMLWPAERPLCSAVSAMGFGGINTHVVMEGVASARRQMLSADERGLLSAAQDAELFLFAAQDAAALGQQVEHLLTFAPRLARAELSDLAAHLATMVDTSRGPLRAALVAATPQELYARLTLLQTRIRAGDTTYFSPAAGLMMSCATTPPRIGFLFPGQGSPYELRGGIWAQRFPDLLDLFATDGAPHRDARDTALVQPAIVAASLAGLRLLRDLKITATIALGHSLGEVIGLHWAGAIDEAQLVAIAGVRGRAMAALDDSAGAMVSVGADGDTVAGLLAEQANGHHGPDGSDKEANHSSALHNLVVIAAYNSPYQTVIAGDADAVATMAARAQENNLRTTRLPVSHAFHSPLVAAATPALSDFLMQIPFQPLQRTLVSTVTAAPLAPDADLCTLLGRQITAPVRFVEALQAGSPPVDLWIEVGPGDVLTRLVAENLEAALHAGGDNHVTAISTPPIIALDAGRGSLQGLLVAAGAAFALGVEIDHTPLFRDRFVRPFDLAWNPTFLTNPCEMAPTRPADGEHQAAPQPPVSENIPDGDMPLDDIAAGRESVVRADANEPVCEVLRRLIAARTELPLAAISDDAHLLNDLHLNSISVSQLVAEAAQSCGRHPPALLTDYAGATVAAIARAIEELPPSDASLDDPMHAAPPGVDHWVHPFVVKWQPQPLVPRKVTSGTGQWQVIAPPAHPWAAPLQDALAQLVGRGVVLCLPPDLDERHIPLLLEWARPITAAPDDATYVLVQTGSLPINGQPSVNSGAAAFARTLHLEIAPAATCVINVPACPTPAQLTPLTDAITTEITAARGYVEVYYDAHATRFVPRLQPYPLSQAASRRTPAVALTHDDVLLVTGGGKGITAECALALAQTSGVKLALLGRADPASDDELAANLARMAEAQVIHRYLAADVTDAAAVQRAVADIEATLGPVTAILHGAARNVPQRLATLDAESFAQTLAPKVQGLRNVLGAVTPERLRLLISFGSIIARSGLWGQADYGVANQWLAHLTDQYAQAHPACYALTVEWSVWAGVGMGARLGRVDALMQAGVDPIPASTGVALLSALLAQPRSPGSVIVMGRAGGLPTLQLAATDLPFMRFLEQPRVHYPGIELVVDIELAIASDPYLAEHAFAGTPLFPAVMTLEAMTQVACALRDTGVHPHLREIQWSRPITVPPTAPIMIRVAALARDADTIEVVIRSAETAFQVDHCRALCDFAPTVDVSAADTPVAEVTAQQPPLALDAARDLYGPLLFHTGRFQRVANYRRLSGAACLAEIAPSSPGTAWFGHYLPAQLCLGDPARRDAAIHAIQACIPHATVLPAGVERLVIHALLATEKTFVRACERERHATHFLYDLEIIDAAGNVCEQWIGLRLQRIETRAVPATWPVALLRPYVERRLHDLLDVAPGETRVRNSARDTKFQEINIVLEDDSAVPRATRRDRAVARALGVAYPVRHRANGKPEVDTPTDNPDISVAHTLAVTLVITGPTPVGCDLETIEERAGATWLSLLGPSYFTLAKLLQHEAAYATQMSESEAATRVWAAGEALKKAGAGVSPPLLLTATTPDGWIVLRSGYYHIATWQFQLYAHTEPLVLALVVGKEQVKEGTVSEMQMRTDYARL